MAKKPKNKLKRIGVMIIIFAFISLAAFFIINRPSNNRNWEYGMDKLAGVRVNGTKIEIDSLRDIDIVNDQAVFKYAKRIVRIPDATKVWFMFEPFSIPSVKGFKGVAHTYFVFDFESSPSIAISVEARREKGEDYSAEWGLFNKFELMNIWSTETDATVQRAVLRKSELYMFPLTISKKETQGLLLQLAKDTQELESHPRFYNSLFANCTNELAKSANKSKPGIIPFNIALFFPGFSDKELYRLKLIPHDKSLAQEKAEYYVSDLVNKFYRSEDFPLLLRDSLPRKSLASTVLK